VFRFIENGVLVIWPRPSRSRNAVISYLSHTSPRRAASTTQQPIQLHNNRTNYTTTEPTTQQPDQLHNNRTNYTTTELHNNRTNYTTTEPTTQQPNQAAKQILSFSVKFSWRTFPTLHEDGQAVCRCKRSEQETENKQFKDDNNRG